MDVLLLGPVEVVANGDRIALRGPKQRALLAMLALHAGMTVAADELIDGLWGEEPPATATKLVQLYVSHVRKALAHAGQEERIVTHGRGYQLRVRRDQVDVGRFERLLAQGDPRGALDLWRGRPLAGVDGEPFALGEVRRLEELRSVALELAIDQDLQAGRHREALAELEGLIAREPLRERLHAQRMLALYRAGRQAEALDAYRQARDVLIRDVGIEPGPELRRLQDQMLRQDPALHPPEEAGPQPSRADALEQIGSAAERAAAGRAGWRVAEDDVAAAVVELQAVRERETLAGAPMRGSAPPFMGLASFGIDDADVYFGRERLVAELVARVPGSRLLGIVGPSGSGKSSLLCAGLLAALADGALPGSEDWPRALVRPGRHPLQALEALPTGDRCVLAVDQFEELFTACADERERARFVDALVEIARDPARPVLVVLAIRADFYGHCASHPELSRALGINHVLVGPMHREELRRAIELPARRAGLAVEPALVDALVADVADEPGGLPLLSTALLELWDRRDEDGLTLAAYEASGGVRGAVARLAERAYEGLDDPGREASRRILLRLSGDGDTRVRVPLGDIGHERVLESLVAERLVTVGEDQVELAHEALLREWPRLREWLDEDAEGRRLHRHLAQAAREWDAAGHDPAELYRGTRLAATRDWAGHHADELNDAERRFLAESHAAAERVAARERVANRRLRTLLAGAAGLLVLAIAAGVLAMAQREQAQDAALAADAQRIGAAALSNDRLDQALLLARAGTALAPSRATRGNLLSVLTRQPAVLGELRGDGWPLYSAATNGALVAMGDERGGVLVHDTRSRRLVSRYRSPDGQIPMSIDFAPRASLMALTWHSDRRGTTNLDLVDPGTGKLVRRVSLPPPAEDAFFVFAEPRFDDDGSHVIVQQGAEAEAGATSVSRVRVRDGAIERRRRLSDTPTISLSATADRTRMFVAVPDDRVYEIDPDTLAVRDSWPSDDRGGAVSPDGSTYAVGDGNGGVRLIDTATGRERAFEGGHADGEDMRMAFSPDGSTVATSTASAEVLLWNVAGRRVRERLTSHTELAPGLAFSPDGTLLYTAGNDAKLTIWDVTGDRRLARRFPAGPSMGFAGGSPKGTAVSPDGRTLAVTQQDGTVDLLDTGTFAVRRRARVMDGAALAAVYSSDGGLLAVTGEGSRVHLRDARTLAPVRGMGGDDGFAQGLALSPDGRRIATASFLPSATPADPSGALRLFDAVSGRALGSPVAVASPDLAFSPDGRLLAAAVLEGDSLVLSADDGRRVARLKTGDDGRSVAFSPDGRQLALGLYGGEVRIYSTATWREVGAPLRGHRARVTALDFTRDGSRLLTGGADGTLRLWDTASRQPIGTDFEVEPDAYMSASFSPDGTRVLGVPSAGRGLSWDLRPLMWDRHACLVAGRDLTDREWRDALPDRPKQRVC